MGELEFVHFSRCSVTLRELMSKPVPGSTRTPAAGTFHTGDLAGLLYVTVGKQLE